MHAKNLPWSAFTLLVVCMLVLALSNRGMAQAASPHALQIIVPGEDRFTPFAITIRVGQTVQWVNNDSDDHCVVSNDAFNTAGHRGVAQVLPANGGKLSLTFRRAGSFPFYCCLHSRLDGDNQPVAPGPDGGIQDQNGNYGTPMNGIITVIEDN